MEQLPQTAPPAPAYPRAAVSTPLVDANIYRPGPYLALSLLAFPVLVALVGAAIFINVAGRVPVWLPLLLVLWVPCLAVLALLLKNVRTSATGIAVGRPWQRWQELPWASIEHVDRRGMFIRMASAEGVVISFAPALLRDGLRLRRQLLLRLPPHILGGHLRQEAQSLVMGDIFATPEGGLSGNLRAHPLRRWKVATVVVALLALTLAVLAITQLQLPLGLPLAALGALLAGGALAAWGWLMQEVIVNERGISVVRPFRDSAHEMRWDEIELVERDPREVMLRLRGDRRLRCAGPMLFRRTQRDLMRAFIHEYCVSRGVPVVQRIWML